jgi:hypothetical protein
MEIKAKTRTEQILIVMHILAWMALVGFVIEAGAMSYTYFVSIFYEDGARDLYNGLNYLELRQYNFWQYTLSISFRVAIRVMQAYTSWLVIKCLMTVKLDNPFKPEVAQQIEKISYLMLSTWVVAMVHNLHAYWMTNLVRDFVPTWISGEFIFAAGLLFIVAQIFKRGVEIQSESELTV